MQYLLQILHVSCQVQRLPRYQGPWSVLLRNRIAERFASVSEDELCRFFYFNVYFIQTKVLLLFFNILNDLG